MATFPSINPSFGFTKENDPNVRVIKLGDGYQHRVILGLPDNQNGKKFNWDILKDFNSKKKWMLAGGLNIDNIKKAIDVTKAPAIDISSGLENRKGIKDPKLIEDFIIKCKNL